MLSVHQFVGSNVGEYQIERLLGQNQLGAAYLARLPGEGKRAIVTIFNLPEGLSSQEHEQLSRRFAKEGEVLARMSHPHILPTYASGIQPGYVYLITAFTREASLAQFLKKNDHFTPQQILPMLKQLAEALDYVHDQAIVHGMLSLSNVVMSNELDVRIAGFGLSAILEMYGNPKSTAPLAQLTHERNLFLLGNVEYISPERVIGQPIDERADIYALGVMLFTLLSGTHPFRGTEPLDVALQRLQQPVPSLHAIRSDISEAFDVVIGQAMARDPAKRLRRASDIAVLFECVLQSQGHLWGVNTTATGQAQADGQTTLPPTVNWFDEEVVPSGQWAAAPPAAPDTPPVPAEVSFSTGKAPDSLGGTDPFAWWATTSTGQAKVAPAPGTFPWSSPIRKARANAKPGQIERRKLLTMLATGAVAAGVTITGISFARLRPGTQQSTTQSAGGSTAQVATTGGDAPTTGATPGTQPGQGTPTPAASGTPRATTTPGAQGSPTTQPTPGAQPTATQAPQPTQPPQPTPTPPPSHTGTVIGHTNMGNNSAVAFTNPANGQSSLLIRLANGSFVACETACTHAGVPVNYNAGSGKLVCPAHQATFDPANGFAPTNPAPSPLPRVSIRVNGDGTITTG